MLMWAIYPPGSLGRETVDTPMRLDPVSDDPWQDHVASLFENQIVKRVNVGISPVRLQKDGTYS